MTLGTRTVEIDRLTPRERPGRQPAMYQSWHDLLFAHWAFATEDVAPLLPPGLELDTFDGRAWIGIVPFTMRGIRARGLPAVPGCSALHELNVRTYVHRQGVPGVWFFSLDAAHKLAVRVARRFFHLPYFDAAIQLDKGPDVETDRIRYESVRTHRDAPWAALSCAWEVGRERPSAELGSLEFFLVERYCLYATRGERVYRGRIHHEPWQLHDAEITDWSSSMLGQLGLEETDPPAHVCCARDLSVAIWKLERS